MGTEAFWNGLFDSRWDDCTFGAEAIRLVYRLRRLGYCEGTRRMYGQMVVHFGHVLAGSERVAAEQINEAVIQKFLREHVPMCRCYRQPPGRRYSYAGRALGHFLAMLREEGVLAPQALGCIPPYNGLLEGYCQFLAHERGLATRTVSTYRGFVRDFLVHRSLEIEPEALVRLSAKELFTFARQRGARLGVSSWNHLVLALRGFYGWLDLQGYQAKHLLSALPLRRRYQLSDVPCALGWEEVQRVLAAVDRNGLDGRRNYAMLLMIATYGLRTCEVRALRCEDIDWQKDELTIYTSKTGRTRRLPLTRPVGEALLEYLRHERPASVHREVFLSRRPPQGPLRNKFYHWVARCFLKAGVPAPHRGPHVLRHSLAVHLLQRGETLKGIGDLLGHRNPETTFIYTKLQVDDLRQVAIEPEVMS
jgi:integrase/recombinase XerD